MRRHWNPMKPLVWQNSGQDAYASGTYEGYRIYTDTSWDPQADDYVESYFLERVFPYVILYGEDDDPSEREYEYFGPFLSAAAAKQIAEALHQVAENHYPGQGRFYADEWKRGYFP